MRTSLAKGLAAGAVAVAVAMSVVLGGCGSDHPAASGSPTMSSSVSTPTSSPTPSEGPTASATPTSVEPTTATCSFTKQEATPGNRAGDALVAYFRAINDKEYGTAFDFLSDDLKAEYAGSGGTTDTGLANFTRTYGDHVACVRVVSVMNAGSRGDANISASLGIQWWRLEFEVTYLTPFEAGGGLPQFYKVHADPHATPGQAEYEAEILEVATG